MQFFKKQTISRVNRLISTSDKKNIDFSCCGCSSCASSCPQNSISMYRDAEGFLYPRLSDSKNCINCGLCDKVCPVTNHRHENKPLKMYAYKNPCDEVRMSSSSGGFFSLAASYVIKTGGVVFGVRYDKDWMPEYAYIERDEDIVQLQGSKYAQASPLGMYPMVRKFLEDGKMVLFTGTPCQISGLKYFLRKDYPLLLTVDVVCHAVPSPVVWREYLNSVSKGKEISYVNMRDKSTGWSNFSYSCSIGFSDGTLVRTKQNENPYMKGFTSDLYNRPSCTVCNSKNGCSGSDITIGDFWRIWNVYPEYDDNKGVNLLLVRSSKGLEFVKKQNVFEVSLRYDELRTFNKGLTIINSDNSKRKVFFQGFEKNKEHFDRLVENVLNSPIHSSFKEVIKRFVHV